MRERSHSSGVSICRQRTRGAEDALLQVVVVLEVFKGRRVNLSERYDYPVSKVSFRLLRQARQTVTGAHLDLAAAAAIGAGLRAAVRFRKQAGRSSELGLQITVRHAPVIESRLLRDTELEGFCCDSGMRAGVG